MDKTGCCKNVPMEEQITQNVFLKPQDNCLQEDSMRRHCSSGKNRLTVALKNYKYMSTSHTKEILQNDYQLFLEGHTDTVKQILVSRGNKFIISCSLDQTIRTWDFQVKRQLFILRGHTSSVNTIAITGDTRLIISGSSDSTIILWNFQERAIEAILRGHSAQINSLVLTHDDKHIVSGSDDCTVRVWCILNQQQVSILKTYINKVISLVITNDSSCMISASSKGLIVWNVRDQIGWNIYEERTSVKKGKYHLDLDNTEESTDKKCVAITNNNEYIVFGSNENDMKI